MDIWKFQNCIEVCIIAKSVTSLFIYKNKTNKQNPNKTDKIIFIYRNNSPRMEACLFLWAKQSFISKMAKDNALSHKEEKEGIFVT